MQEDTELDLNLMRELAAESNGEEYSPSDQVESSNEPVEPTDEAESSEETEPAEADNQKEPDDEVEPEEPQKVTVKIGDKEEEVTLDELKQSYMRQKDYTHKTQELAEQRKQVEAQTKVRTDAVERLNKLISDLEATVVPSLQDSPAKQIRNELAKVNVMSLTNEQMAEYNRLEAQARQLEARDKAKYDQYIDAVNKAREEQERLINEQYAQDQQVLAQELPEFADPVKREKLNQDISQFLVEIYGDKKAAAVAQQVRSKEDYKTLYYASLGMKYSKENVPEKVTTQIKNVKASNTAGKQQVRPSATADKETREILNRAKANGSRGASQEDLIRLFQLKGI